MAVNSGAQVWSPFRELSEVVHNAIHRKQPDAVHDLEVAIRRHKPDFISLLQNPARSAQHRDMVKKSTTVGLPIQGEQRTQIFSQQFLDEALILSDLFNLNEMAAVELLMAGENQQPNFPGLTRGLVAVLLYYDGRRSIVNALRTLIQSREGRTWTLGLNEELVSMTTRFTDQLVEEGLVDKILDLITNLDVAQELMKLQKERALGPPKHRKQVSDLYKEIKTTLAECLFCLACQQPLTRGDTIRLIAFLKADQSVSPDGSLEPVSLCLLMTLLYCLDVSILDQEDAGDLMQRLSIISDADYLPDLHREMRSDQRWASPGLKATVQFTWSLALRQLSQYQGLPGVNEFCEEDELIMDVALADNAFFFIKDFIVKCPEFHQEEFYLRRIHGLVTDFIFHMPLKWKELRNRGDETAKIIQAHQLEGLEPSPNLRRDFEHMLQLISDLYSKDPLHLELAMEYWCPPEPFSGHDMFGAVTTGIGYRPPQKQVGLYKFVRIAGDLLPASLYIPYVNMLAGLSTGPQCAYHLFHLLKLNGTSQGGSASLVSWDHIFYSLNQYYSSLRREVPTATEGGSQRYRQYHRGITPQELQGLITVLSLARKVAEQSEKARIALCENQHWMPVVLLFGLLGCSIPPELKAELLTTLSALGKTPEIATNLWQSLEVAQIVGTIQSGNQQQVGGLQVELDEIEARNEEYPLTRAFLGFMNTLTDVPVPAALGAGYRVPGFDPYLTFLRDTILLKFNSRAYKTAGEKWMVAAGALEVLHKLIQIHEISMEDFIDQHVETPTGKALASKPPGHTLLIHMLNETGLLKMVLYILDEAIREFETFANIPGKEKLERASLLCLKMIEVTLEKEDQLIDTLRESGASVFVSSMDKLLMAVNPRSGKPDHMVNVAKYVMFGTFLPEHCMSAVRILYLIGRSALIQSDLVGLFTAEEATSRDLLQGFVECLEADDVETKPDIEKIEDLDEDLTTVQFKNASRQQLLHLLLHSVAQPAPNLAHFLLGFELQKPVGKTNLQDPGVMGSPKTCLHAILTLLDKGVGTHSGPSSLLDTPKLAELGYHMIYKLCANKDTAAPTLRYLRTTRDFLYKHLQHLPFLPQAYSGNKVSAHQSWLLKSVAIELRMTSLNRQRSNTQRLMRLLLDDCTDEQTYAIQVDGGEADYTSLDQDQSLFLSSRQAKGRGITGLQTRRKILSVLDSLDFTQTYPQQLQLEFFDPRLVDQVITTCEKKTEQGLSYYDIKALHRILMNEINNLQGTSMAGQRSLVMEEIQAVLNTVVIRNSVRESLHEKRQAFEAWRYVVEVLLTACPEDLLTGETRQNVLFELLQDLLKKVADDDALPELSAPVAGVILTLMANLRQCFITDKSENAESSRVAQYISSLDHPGLPPPQAVFSGTSSSRTLFSTSLQVVLKGLIEYIFRSSGGQQRVRANLYGALLYYLQIAQKPTRVPQFLTSGESSGVEKVLISQESEYEQLTKENISTIMSFGDHFMDIVCRDACDGHDVGRMLALSVLDAIVGLDKYHQWLSFLSSKGYLQHLIDSLVSEDDQHLQALLSNNPDTLRVLYIYESKMGLFTRIGETATGAHTLLRTGIIQRLAECSFFDMRPEIDRRVGSQGDLDPMSDDDFIPSPMARYRNLLSSGLKLNLAILTSLGIENKDCGSQVMQFIVAHIDVFHVIIREKLNTMNLQSLKELALLTAVFGRAAYHGDISHEYFPSEAAALEYKGHVGRIQRQMIALLPKYCLSDKMTKQLQNAESRNQGAGHDTKAQIILAVQEITANVMAFCRALVSSSGSSAKYCRILFGPSLEEALARDLTAFEDYQGSSMSAMQTPNLGLVVFHLRQCTNQFMIVYDSHQDHLRKLQSIADLTNEDLKHFLDSGTSEKMSTQQRQQLARKKLVQIVGHKVKELQHYSYILENCLFILWRHLEFYLLHCVPMDKQPSLYQVHVKKNQQLRRLQDIPGMTSTSFPESDLESDLDESTRGVTHGDIELLKMEAVSAINETLFEKLQKIDQCFGKSRTQYGFTEALIRRLKRLLKLHTGKS